jgi:hypothetical protein
VNEGDFHLGLPSCSGCKDRLTEDSEGFAEKFRDPLRVSDRNGSPTTVLRDFLLPSEV